MELWGYFVIIIMFLVFAYFCVGIITVGIINHRIFQCRGKEEHDPYFVHFEDYSNMVRTEYEMSYKGKTIRGYIYAKQHSQDSKGFFILAHGMFSTHLNYLPDIEILISCGYDVLAFDQYGVGISDGDEIVSLEHGTRVLKEVIADVKKRNINRGLPISLYGHSWGGYCVTSVLKYHSDMKYVISRSGPISPVRASMTLLKSLKPHLYYFLRPIIPMSIFFVCGRRSVIKSLSPLKRNTTSKTLLIYALNDPRVDEKNSQAIYFQNHKKNNVEVFIKDKGLHNSLLTEDSYHLLQEKKKAYHRILEIEDEQKKAQALQEYISCLTRAEYIEYDVDVKKAIETFLED